LKEYKDELETCREQLKVKRAENIELELENLQLKTDLETFEMQGSNDSLHNVVQSAPTSRRTSPIGSGNIEGQSGPGRTDKSFQLMHTMHKCIEEKSREISQLKNLLEVIFTSLSKKVKKRCIVFKIQLCFNKTAPCTSTFKLKK
jgi:regulator of replication initiation timing